MQDFFKISLKIEFALPEVAGLFGFIFQAALYYFESAEGHFIL
jgi:hypothetical protein